MTEQCWRCQASPASPILWPVCEPCWQDQCEEAHQALCELDAISRLMATEGLNFPGAVERLGDMLDD